MISFFRKKIDTNMFTNLIAEGTTISGDTFTFTGTLKIRGTIHGGSINAIDGTNTSIIIENSADVCCENIGARNIVISGGNIKIKNIFAEDELIISANTVIRNSILYYRHLTIESGALLHDCILKNLDNCSEAEVV